MLRLMVAAALTLFFSGMALAEDCGQAGTQAEINDCTASDATRADADLNAAYKKLMPMLGAGDQKLLRDAQRAWITFRDAECAFRTQSYSDGSIYPTLLSNCVAELTAARAAQLTAQIDCGEGDLCPPHVAPN